MSNKSNLPTVVSPFLTKFNPNEGTFVSNIVREAIAHVEHNRTGMKPKPRPSSMPTCSLLLWMEKFRGEALGYYYGTKELPMEYYTNVGNVLHEKAQYFVGHTGVSFGDWKCVNKRCKKGIAACETRTADGRIIKEGKITRKDSTNNKCPKCDEPMLYVEKKVEYKGIMGYVDGIWKIPKSEGGGYWLVDYKTTSMRKIEKGEYPERAHINQLPFYAYVLSKKYKMDIKGFSLVYMPRDNPQAFYEYREEWTDKWKKVGKKIAKREARNLEVMNRGVEECDYEEAVACKACKSKSDYFKTMHNGFDECPMLDVCFSEAKLTKRLDNWIKVHADGEALDDTKFKEAVQILSHKAYKDKTSKNKLIKTSGKKLKRPEHVSL